MQYLNIDFVSVVGRDGDTRWSGRKNKENTSLYDKCECERDRRMSPCVTGCEFVR